jgi:hypothetical protein
LWEARSTPTLANRQKNYSAQYLFKKIFWSFQKHVRKSSETDLIYRGQGTSFWDCGQRGYKSNFGQADAISLDPPKNIFLWKLANEKNLS